MLRPAQDALFDIIDAAELPYGCNVFHHDREWLALASLPRAQGCYRRIVFGIAYKVETSETLDCQDAAFEQQVHTSGDDRIALLSRMPPYGL